MVVGGEFGVHEFAAETQTAAKCFVRLRLLIASEKGTVNFIGARATWVGSLLSGNLIEADSRGGLFRRIVVSAGRSLRNVRGCEMSGGTVDIVVETDDSRGTNELRRFERAKMLLLISLTIKAIEPDGRVREEGISRERAEEEKGVIESS